MLELRERGRGSARPCAGTAPASSRAPGRRRGRAAGGSVRARTPRTAGRTRCVFLSVPSAVTYSSGTRPSSVKTRSPSPTPSRRRTLAKRLVPRGELRRRSPRSTVPSRRSQRSATPVAVRSGGVAVDRLVGDVQAAAAGEAVEPAAGGLPARTPVRAEVVVDDVGDDAARPAPLVDRRPGRGRSHGTSLRRRTVATIVVDVVAELAFGHRCIVQSGERRPRRGDRVPQRSCGHAQLVQEISMLCHERTSGERASGRRCAPVA